MKKLALLTLIVIIAALSVMSVSAAPRDRYYDQSGDRHWCNTDSYGCWVTGENGDKEYIMFWSEAAAEWIMGPDSGAPIGIYPNTPQLELDAPKVEIPIKKPSGGITQPECGEGINCPKGQRCDNGICIPNTTDKCTKNSECPEGQLCQQGVCKAKSTCELTVEKCNAQHEGYKCSVTDNCACSCKSLCPTTAEQCAASAPSGKTCTLNNPNSADCSCTCVCTTTTKKCGPGYRWDKNKCSCVKNK